LYKTDQAAALSLITGFSVETGNTLVAAWKSLFHYLFMKYMDGNRKKSEGRQLLDNGNGRGIPPPPSHPGYGKEWERRMVENTGGRYRK